MTGRNGIRDHHVEVERAGSRWSPRELASRSIGLFRGRRCQQAWFESAAVVFYNQAPRGGFIGLPKAAKLCSVLIAKGGEWDLPV